MASLPLPTTMKGVIVNTTGDPEVLEYRTDLPIPTPQEGEVLIKNTFIGINFIDALFRSGRYPVSLPSILGAEAEGTIVSLSPTGSHYGLKAGDLVVWQGIVGAYAEYSVCSASKVFVLPPNTKPGVAAASLSQGLTALTFINRCYPVQNGDWILVNGASGGVGNWFCRLLRDVGARVIGTATTDAKLQIAKNNGAEFVLNYTSNGLVDKIMDETKGQGVAAVFDSVGAATFDVSLQVLAQDGSMISVGNTSGPLPLFNIRDLQAKNLRLMKPTPYGYINTQEEFVGWAEKLFEFVGREGDKLEGMVTRVYDLEDVGQAHRDMEGRKTAGKLLLRV